MLAGCVHCSCTPLLHPSIATFATISRPNPPAPAASNLGRSEPQLQTMGSRFSSCAAKKQQPAAESASQPPCHCCCAGVPAAAAATTCRLSLTPAADGESIKVTIRPVPACIKTLQEENCLVKVQLQVGGASGGRAPAVRTAVPARLAPCAAPPC